MTAQQPVGPPQADAVLRPGSMGSDVAPRASPAAAGSRGSACRLRLSERLDNDGLPVLDVYAALRMERVELTAHLTLADPAAEIRATERTDVAAVAAFWAACVSQVPGARQG